MNFKKLQPKHKHVDALIFITVAETRLHYFLFILNKFNSIYKSKYFIMNKINSDDVFSFYAASFISTIEK